MKLRTGKTGIQGKMLIAVVIFLLCVFVVWGGLLVYLSTNLQKRVCDNVYNMVKERCSSIEAFVNGQFTMLEVMADYIAWESQDEPLDDATIQVLLEIMMTNSEMERLMAANRTGGALYNDGTRSNVSDRDYFQTAMAGSRMISEPLISRVDGAEYMILAVPVRDEQGQVNAMLAGSLSMDKISQLLLTQAEAEDEGYSFLTDSEGNMLALSGNIAMDEAYLDQSVFSFYEDCPVRWGNMEEIRGNMADGQPGTLMIRNSRTGQWYYVAYSPVADIRTRYLFFFLKAETATAPYQFINVSHGVLLGSLVLGAMAVLLYCVWLMSRKHRQLEQEARQDSLTKLLNHESMRREVTRVLRESGERGIQMLMIFDLDRFKEVNDTFGHQAGDKVLLAVADQLRSIFRSSDLMGRVGGDEFMVLMRDISSETMGFNRANKLCRTIHQITLAEWPGLEVWCSVGVAFTPVDGSSYEQLYQQADLALYRAKRAGRHRVAGSRVQCRAECVSEDREDT